MASTLNTGETSAGRTGSSEFLPLQNVQLLLIIVRAQRKRIEKREVEEEHSMTNTRVLVLDGQPLTGAGLAVLINHYDGFQAQTFVPAETTFNCICSFDPCVIIFHPHHTDAPKTRELYRQVAACEQRMSLLLLSGNKCNDMKILREAFHAGIDGILDRDTTTIDILIEALKRLVAEETLWKPHMLRQMLQWRENELARYRDVVDTTFTPREQQMFKLLATGMPNKAIANHLQISERTVEGHVSHIIAKLGVCSRTEVIAAYLRLHPHDDADEEQERSIGA